VKTKRKLGRSHPHFGGKSKHFHFSLQAFASREMGIQAYVVLPWEDYHNHDDLFDRE